MISPETMADLQQAAENAAREIRDPELMRQACENMDRIREENRRLFGKEDSGINIIREMRDSRSNA